MMQQIPLLNARFLRVYLRYVYGETYGVALNSAERYRGVTP